ncbi:MAG TPA: hypothetical protein QF646_04195 [Candidatus Poseidoniales archaeon]|nr:hypothetical protein [Candidatus Poseidoniales archaeon]
MRAVALVIMLLLLLPVSGCLGGGEEEQCTFDGEGGGDECTVASSGDSGEQTPPTPPPTPPTSQEPENGGSDQNNTTSVNLSFHIGSPNGTISEMSDAFTKHIEVFGSHIVATTAVSDDDLLHAATVFAEYLDNDEDGVVDNQAISDNLSSRSATLVMGATESDFENAIEKIPESMHQRFDDGEIILQNLFGDETINNDETPDRFDASLEEVLHLITHGGWAHAYPNVFAEQSGSLIANLTDTARGGHFEEASIDDCDGGGQCALPSGGEYPENAWYTYDDDTCSYACMITEYVYWGLTSMLGAQAQRCSEIDHEWDPCTFEALNESDPGLVTLLTDSTFNLPSILPDGNYSPVSSTISSNDEGAGNETNESVTFDPCTEKTERDIGPWEGNQSLNILADGHALDTVEWQPFELCKSWNNGTDEAIPTMLIFASTDCGHCWNHGTTISQWEIDYAGRMTILILAVNFETNDKFTADRNEVEGFQGKLTGPLCYQDSRSCADRPGDAHTSLYLDDLNQTQMGAWQVSSTPTHIIIGNDGIVLWHQKQHRSDLGGDGENTQSAIERLIGPQTSD